MNAPLSILSASINKRSTNTFSYFPHHVKCIENHYTKENLTGGISLCVAENKLCSDLILEKIRSFEGLNVQSLCYSDPSGHYPFKQTLVKFLSKHVFDHHAVDTNHIVLGAGCTAILYQLSLTLFNPGDALLIPVPYYPVFDKDFMNVGQVHIEEVLSNPDKNFSFTLIDLQNAYDKASSSGHPPKALLLTNPHNPLGTIFSKDFIRSMVDWCRSKHMHIISDEIYALSTFGSEKFTSIVEVLENKLHDDVHVLWGLSKDLGSSGFRCGILYTQNHELMQTFKYISDAFQVSVMTQQIALAIIDDEEFMSKYLVENRTKLAKSYKYLEENLASVGIITVPAVSSIFAFVDFRPLLSEDSFDAEKLLFEDICTEGVVLTPGVCCHCPVPGFFRICYAWVPYEEMTEGINRLMNYVNTHKKETSNKRVKLN